jgi:hypothetical protein
MGVVAEFETVPIERRAQILTEIAGAGIEVADEGDVRGVYWYGCRRGRTSIGLAFIPSTPRDNVCLYCSYLDYLRRPRSVRLLFRDVLSAVRFTVPESEA